MAARRPHTLDLAEIEPTPVLAGSTFHHIFLDRFPDPLGFGYRPSRFSDPRTKTGFGVYYVGATFEVAFLETIVRDRRNGHPGMLILSEADLDDYAHVVITVLRPLSLVDLRGGNAVMLGLPTNTIRGSAHRLGQRTSLAVYQRREGFDGIWYPSRLNDEDNVAVFDRAVGCLAAGPRRTLNNCVEIAPLLDRYRIALV